MKKELEMMIDPGVVYLNHAAIGPMPREVYQLHEQSYRGMARRGESSFDLEDLLNHWDSIRSQFASLVNGQPEGVVVTSNTASGLHLVADGLSHLWKPGMNIVLTNVEFTTNSYVWQQLVKRYDLELRVVRYDATIEEWSTKIDWNTKLVAISFVQFSNGYRCDLAAITELAHENNAYVVTDAIQGLGAVKLDVKSSDVDFIAAGGYKWLLGPLGSGYFYTKPEHLSEMDSVLVGWFSDRNFKEMSHHHFHPWEDARQFQQSLGGHFPALDKSLEIILDLEPSKTYNHVCRLIDYLVNSLQDSKYVLSSNLNEEHRSGILKIDHPDAEYIVNKLKQENIIVSLRDGGIRISPHRHNTLQEMENLSEALLKFVS